MLGSTSVDRQASWLARRPWALQLLSSAWLLSKRKPLGALGGGIILVVVLAALLAPVLAPYSYEEVHPVDRLQGPSGKYLLGTDDLGRDILSRILYGARVSLLIGVGAVALGIMHGSLWGLVSGYVRGTFDNVTQRIMEAVMAVPLLLMAMVIVAVLGSSLLNVIFALSFVLTPIANRVIRAQVLSVKEEPYIEAARALGAARSRILLKHILPNVASSIMVLATINLGFAIIAESSLAFLGLGVPLPTPTWGGMLGREGRQYMVQDPWLAIFPGVTIGITVLAFNVLGDALRDVLDPRLKNQGE